MGGAVLHLIWINVLLSEDDSLKDFKLDVDFICPRVPIGSESWYFNNLKERRNCLAEIPGIENIERRN